VSHQIYRRIVKDFVVPHSAGRNDLAQAAEALGKRRLPFLILTVLY